MRVRKFFGKNINFYYGMIDMSKEHKNKRDTKKKPALSPKEKKAAKKGKANTKNVFHE